MSTAAPPRGTTPRSRLRPTGSSRLQPIAGRLTIPALALGVAVLGYVGFGAGGGVGGVAIVASLALGAVGILRARGDPAEAAMLGLIARRTVMLLPGGALVYLAFHAGGFFPGPPALAAVILALILAARLVLGSARGGRAIGPLAVAFTAYAAWVLLSGSWSSAPERALAEGDLALVYGLGFVLLATAVTGPRDLRWVVGGLALGSVVVCLGAFASRVQPKLWPIDPSLDTARLSYPLTYWNTLGLVAALGIIVCVGLTSDDRGSRLVKALSAVAIPLLAATLLLTFSRGAIAAGIAGLLAYVMLGRPRSLVSAALAVGPSAAYAVITAYRATSLAMPLDGSVHQATQGHHLAVVVGAGALVAGVARAVLAGIDGPLVRHADRHPVSARAALRGAVIAGALVLGAALALGVPGTVDKQFHRFVQGNRGVGGTQVRDRLTDPGADGRIDLWRVATHQFDGAPLRGTGAGTFEEVWAVRHPPTQTQVLDAHSIYMENLGELGLVGLALVLAVVLGCLGAIGWRLRGRERALHAAAFAVLLTWALRAGIDWDWEMPAVTLPVFALAGAALWPGSPAPAPAEPRRRRPGLGLAVLLVAVAPALLGVSQSHQDAALAAVAANDCATAATEARSALRPLSFRRAPHEILAYCLAARGEGGPARAEIARAVSADPGNWETHYGQAIILAATGGDPRPAAQAALARNPSDPVATAAEAKFRTDRPAHWPEDAASAPLPIGGQYGTTLAGLRGGTR